ncbi:MAG: GNAT family N-acetyltransferase [Cyanobacteria bacterium J06597_1]
MAMELEFRLVTEMDLPVLRELYALMDGEEPLAEAVVDRLFAEISAVPNYDIYLAELDGIAVGTFALLMMPTMMHRGFHRSAVVDAVAVHPEYRRRGIGRSLMEEALRLSREARCYKLMLSSNLLRVDAHLFYERLGYEQHGWSYSLTLSEQLDS